MYRETVTVVHGDGSRKQGTITHDRSGSGTQVLIGNRSVSYPGPKSETKVIHDGGRSSKK